MNFQVSNGTIFSASNPLSFIKLNMSADVTRITEKGLKMMGLSTDQLVDTFLKDDRGSLTDDAWPVFGQV